MPEDLTAILYRSEAMIAQGSADESRMLADAARCNESLGITGFIHRESGVYYQWIEGPSGDVDRLYARIQADPRHRGVETLRSGPVIERHFSRWAMGRLDGEHRQIFDWAVQQGVPMRALQARHFLEFLRDCSVEALVLAGQPGYGHSAPG